MSSLASTVTGELVDDMSTFFAPMSSDVVDSLVGQYEAVKKNIVALHEMVGSSEAKSVLHYFVQGNLKDERHGLPYKINQLFELDAAIGELNADFWTRAFNLTDVYQYMPQARRTEWHEQIRNPMGTDDGKRSLQPLPTFEAETVRATIFDLLNSREKFFAERVDGIFRALSRTHVTNQPEGFSKRMILSNVINNWGSVESDTAGYINDLRCVIAKFMGRDEPGYGASSKVITEIRRDNGTWRTIDGGALRMRVYNGVGTAHLEVHPDMAWRLNGVLAMLHPLAIPSKFREKPKKARKLKDFKLMDKPLPFAVINVLASMEQGSVMIEANHRHVRRPIPNSLWRTNHADMDKAIKQQVDAVLLAIGGVYDGKILWQFDYDPKDVVGEIICSGCIPDHKSHQFYPTPDDLAAEAVELASIGSEVGMHWLEPSAGTGGLSDFMPDDAFVQCYEVSELHCKILEAKGYSRTAGTKRTVQCLDFLKLAAEYRGGGYDRVVMNPPFSEGRWLAHLVAAAKVMKKTGKLVAILPASAIGKDLVDGMHHEYSEIYRNKFVGASVEVVILTLTYK